MRVISTEKVPIKMWLPYLEDGAEQQAKNAANLPFVFKHLAIMPDSHQGYGVPIGSVLATQGYVVPFAVGVDIGCFTGDTKVVLADSKTYRLDELAARGGEFTVYACTPEGRIHGASATALKTRTLADLVEVELDNGEKIRCTPDHRFMLRNGEYTAADQLSPETSLMPFYAQCDPEGYFRVQQPNSGKWQRAHWVMARSGLLGPIPSFTDQKTVIHHVNFTETDNTPSNLRFMGNCDHSSYHRGLVDRNEYWHSEEFEAARVAAISAKAQTEEGHLFYAERGTKNLVTFMTERRDEFLASVAGNGERGKEYLVAYNQSDAGRQKSSTVAHLQYRCSLCSAKGEGGFFIRNHFRIEHPGLSAKGMALREGATVNHKVVAVRKVDQREDVYCLQVPGFNNFALAAGVFVHNCGMCAIRTDLDSLPTETLKAIMGKIREKVPVGRQHQSEPQSMEFMPLSNNCGPVIQQEYGPARGQIGTLGGGNHFIEIQKDQEGLIWIMIHSGSRNIGKKVCDYYDDLAKKLNREWCASVPPSHNLAFLPLNGQGRSYLDEMNFCVEFAFANRKLMMRRVLESFYEVLQRPLTEDWNQDLINIAHNYAAMENHFGENVLVHRKGATRARLGETGIIPGSQGTKSYIVIGKGNKESFESCSHGAGRQLSRAKARSTIDLKAEIAALDAAGVVHSIRSEKDLDEAPSAYKNIDEVMANQVDLVDIVVELTPLGVIKG